jgi:hypothetical protein
MSLVEAIFSDNLSRVVTNNIVGNTLSSRGLIMNKVVIKMIRELPTEKASSKSKRAVGTGKSNTIRIPTIEQAKAISAYFENFFNLSNITSSLYCYSLPTLICPTYLTCL